VKTEADLEDLIRGVVANVVSTAPSSAPTRAVRAAPPAPSRPAPEARSVGRDAKPGVIAAEIDGSNGLFDRVDDAVVAAREAQRTLANQSIERRRAYVDAMRAAGVEHAERFARSAHEETGLGRYLDKVGKNVFAATRTLGVEDLEPTAFSGDHGFAIEDTLPWGVVASVTPINSPSAFVINHAITMVAGGNACAFNVHPGCWNTSLSMVRLLNRAIVGAGGPDNLLTGTVRPTLETAKALVNHPGVDMLVITGGAALIADAFATRKRVIAAGPGNPTAVVDETADPRRAAAEVFRGASYENTILCIGEKTCVVAEPAAPAFFTAFDDLPVRRLDLPEVDRVFDTVIDASDPTHPVTRRDFVGRDAEVLLRAAGLQAAKPVGLLVADVERDHPLVRMEQFLPLLPVVRVRDGDEAADLGVEVEGGNRHTVMIHSNHPGRIARFAREADCVICVVNGSSLRGLGVDGEGYPGFTIGTVTGEGLTSTRHYVKARRVSHTR
jgi:acyl-CoA reductase-like NAD-dependent aldehyde dehydrogenase